MKKISKACIIIFIIFLSSNTFSYSQCNDSSSVTLAETNNWIKLIVTQHGEKLLPPISYIVDIKDSCTLRILMMGYDSNTEKMSDTSIVYEISHKEFDPLLSSFSSSNKKNTRFLIKLYYKKLKISSMNQESGEPILDAIGEINGVIIENLQYLTLYINSKEQSLLPERIIKAFTHAKCLCGESQTEIESKTKSTF